VYRKIFPNFDEDLKSSKNLAQYYFGMARVKKHTAMLRKLLDVSPQKYSPIELQRVYVTSLFQYLTEDKVFEQDMNPATRQSVKNQHDTTKSFTYLFWN